MKNNPRFIKLKKIRKLLIKEIKGFNIYNVVTILGLFIYKDKRIQYNHIHKLYSNSVPNPYIIERRVIYMNDWGKDSGIADILQGVLVSYSLSLKYKRKFYIVWNIPFSLTDYLIPASFNWKINENKIYYSKKDTFPLIFCTIRKEPPSLRYLKRIIVKSLFKRSKELHVRSNYFLYKDNYAKLFKELFKPSDILEKELNKYSYINNYYSYTFRFQKLLGDFEEKSGFELEDIKKEILIKNNIDELKKLLKELPHGYKALVTSDSITFLERANGIDDRIIIIPGKIYHPSMYNKKDNKEIKYPFMKSFIDFFMIMGAEKVFRLKTGDMYQSGFPKLAALLGEKPFIDYRF